MCIYLAAHLRAVSMAASHQSLQHVPRVYFIDVSCNLAYLFISSSCFHSILCITAILTSQTYFYD